MGFDKDAAQKVSDRSARLARQHKGLRCDQEIPERLAGLRLKPEGP